MTKTQENLLQEGTNQVSQPNTKNPSMFFQGNHSKHMIMGDKKKYAVGTRRILLTNGTKQVCFSMLSQVEPNCFNKVM